jgi:thiazole synthase
MEVVFQGFKEQIEIGLQNNIPRDARLVIIGQLKYAAEREDLTSNEYFALKNMLGKPEEFQEATQLATFGELIKPQSVTFTAADFD